MATKLVINKVEKPIDNKESLKTLFVLSFKKYPNPTNPLPTKKEKINLAKILKLFHNSLKKYPIDKTINKTARKTNNLPP